MALSLHKFIIAPMPDRDMAKGPNNKRNDKFQPTVAPAKTLLGCPFISGPAELDWEWTKLVHWRTALVFHDDRGSGRMFLDGP